MTTQPKIATKSVSETWYCCHGGCAMDAIVAVDFGKLMSASWQHENAKWFKAHKPDERYLQKMWRTCRGAVRVICYGGM
jgi:hypothetical protein